MGNDITPKISSACQCGPINAAKGILLDETTISFINNDWLAANIKFETQPPESLSFSLPFCLFKQLNEGADLISHKVTRCIKIKLSEITASNIPRK